MTDGIPIREIKKIGEMDHAGFCLDSKRKVVVYSYLSMFTLCFLAAL